jgi:transcriptional regulator with XRE-family HTH domain
MPHTTDVFAGRKTRELRQLRGLSQQQLAEKIGVKFQQVQKYETGKNRISASRLFEIANTLGAPVAAFFPATDQDPNADLIDPRLHELARLLDRMTASQSQSVIDAMTATSHAILTHAESDTIAAE